MREYALQIQEVLNSLGVQACYTKKEDLIYALDESPFGDIYCIYKQEGKIIRSFALFEPEVPSSEREKIMSFVKGLSIEGLRGYFHIDKVLNRVVYSVDYELSGGTDTLGFELFCTYAYERLKSHREVLYWLITGSIAKGIDPEVIG